MHQGAVDAWCHATPARSSYLYADAGTEPGTGTE